MKVTLREDAAAHGLGEAERFVLAPIDLDEHRPLPGPERCAGCGRRLIVRLVPITLDDPSQV